VPFLLNTGTFESTLDVKSRIVIPVPLRELYTGDLVITQGRDYCVWLMTPAVYEFLLESIEDPVWTDEEYTAFQYMHVAPAQKTEIDPISGRIQIPAALKSYANLSKDCLILGFEKRLEIWSKESYKIHMQNMQIKSKDASEKEGAIRLFPKRGTA
jgi:MraZ protein